MRRDRFLKLIMQIPHLSNPIQQELIVPAGTSEKTNLTSLNSDCSYVFIKHWESMAECPVCRYSQNVTCASAKRRLLHVLSASTWNSQTRVYFTWRVLIGCRPGTSSNETSHQAFWNKHAKGLIVCPYFF